MLTAASLHYVGEAFKFYAHPNTPKTDKKCKLSYKNGVLIAFFKKLYSKFKVKLFTLNNRL